MFNFSKFLQQFKNANLRRHQPVNQVELVNYSLRKAIANRLQSERYIQSLPKVEKFCEYCQFHCFACEGRGVKIGNWYDHWFGSRVGFHFPKIESCWCCQGSGLAKKNRWCRRCRNLHGCFSCPSNNPAQMTLLNGIPQIFFNRRRELKFSVIS